MTTPVDQSIVDEIARLLGKISTANGYLTDAGANVLTDALDDIPPEDAITLEVVDENDDLVEQQRRRRSGTLNLTIGLIVPRKGYPQTRSTARMALWDVRRALSIEPREFPTGVNGCGITSMEIGSRSLPPREAGSQYLTGTQSVSVTFIETQPVPAACGSNNGDTP